MKVMNMKPSHSSNIIFDIDLQKQSNNKIDVLLYYNK